MQHASFDAVTLLVDARCTLGEGILWDEQRSCLLWTDITAGALWTSDRDGQRAHAWPVGAELGHLAICRSGRLLLGLAKGLAFAAHPVANGDLLASEPVLPIEPDRPLTRINDGRTDRAGNLVFGTYNQADDEAPTGSFYQFSIRHGLRRLALGGITIPNSICFSLDGGTMYYCDSPTYRIMACDYDAESAGVGAIREFVTLGRADGMPDGSVIDADGCLWNAAWGGSAVRRYAPDGRLLAELAVPAPHVTCVAFGGDAMDTLFITTARMNLTPEALEQAPQSGGVFHVRLPGIGGLADALFID